jgi:valyl-tRNA synthetase
MSKSKGNVVTPLGLLEEHGSDGVRYWAASGRPGADTAFDAGQMRVGRRLAIKLLNASKFALAPFGQSHGDRDQLEASKPAPVGALTVAVDRGLLTTLARLVRESTEDLEKYQYTRVLERTESFFWFFCDNYLELVKARRYGDHGPELAASANSALLASLSAFLRLFAPFLPFACEEIWSWWRPGSVHRATWPTEAELLDAAGGADERGARALQLAAQVLSEIRKRKSEGQRPLKTPVARLVIRAPDRDLLLLADVEQDLRSSGLIQQIDTLTSEALQVDVELAAPEGVPQRAE